MSKSAVADQKGVAPENGDNANKKDVKPTKVLPTNRVALSKQFEIVRAFGAHGGADRNPASNVEVSKIVSLHAATVGLLTPFLADIGLISKGAGGFAPSEEVVDFAGAYEWSAETAFHRVSPVLKKTWFFLKLEPKLRFRPLSKDEAIQELSIASSAGLSYRAHLETLLDYLEKAGIVSLDGGQVRLVRNGASHEDGAPHAPAKETQTEETPIRAAVATSFASQRAGVVAFNISVKVDMTDFGGWEASRISAFFSGIAQVLAAKGDIEEKVSKT